MLINLTSGLCHQASLKITGQLTVPGIAAPFAAIEYMPPVFATAMMIGFIETTCIESIREYLPTHHEQGSIRDV